MLGGRWGCIPGVIVVIFGVALLPSYHFRSDRFVGGLRMTWTTWSLLVSFRFCHFVPHSFAVTTSGIADKEV